MRDKYTYSSKSWKAQAGSFLILSLGAHRSYWLVCYNTGQFLTQKFLDYLEEREIQKGEDIRNMCVFVNLISERKAIGSIVFILSSFNCGFFGKMWRHQIKFTYLQLKNYVKHIYLPLLAL